MRRVYIEKKGSTKKRPLGIPTWSDKLLQEVMRPILEAYYEPQFSRPPTASAPAAAATPRWARSSAGGRHEMVHRGRHRAVLRQSGPLGPAVDPPREDPRRPLPAADREPAPGRIPGGLAVQRHAQRHPAGRGAQPDPLEHLPGPAGPVRRDDAPPEVQPRRPTRKPNPAYARLREQAKRLEKRGTPGRGPPAARAAAADPVPRPDDPDYRRLRYVRYADDFAARLRRPARRGRGDQARHRRVPARPAQAGTVRDEDPDHPRAVTKPRASSATTSRSCTTTGTRPARPPEHQRPGRAASAPGRGAGEMRALPAPREADAPPGTDPRLASSASWPSSSGSTGASWNTTGWPTTSTGSTA